MLASVVSLLSLAKPYGSDSQVIFVSTNMKFISVKKGLGYTVAGGMGRRNRNLVGDRERDRARKKIRRAR